MGKITWLEVIFNLTIIPPYFARGHDCLWFVAVAIILVFLYPYIFLFIYGGRRKQAEGVILLRTFLLVLFSCIYYWLVHKYDYDFWVLINRLLGCAPAFIIGAYLGHFATESSLVGLRRASVQS